MGDVHPLGNPHYWLDPDNGRRIAKGIADKLAEIDRQDAAYFQQRLTISTSASPPPKEDGTSQMKPFRGRKVVTYHNSWPNFAKHFGLNVVGYIEPRPGIPPTPQHTIEIIQMMKRDNVKVSWSSPISI